MRSFGETGASLGSEEQFCHCCAGLRPLGISCFSQQTSQLGLCADIPMSVGIIDPRANPTQLNTVEFLWDPSKRTSVFIQVLWGRGAPPVGPRESSWELPRAQEGTCVAQLQAGAVCLEGR